MISDLMYAIEGQVRCPYNWTLEVSPIKVVTVAVQDEDYGEEGGDKDVMIESNEDFNVINLKVLKILRMILQVGQQQRCIDGEG